METAATPDDVARPIDASLLAAAAQRAAAVANADATPSRAIDAALDVLADDVAELLLSVFLLEQGRLWLVAQRGYAVVPDGITVQCGITGRAIRVGRAQLAPDVHQDPDYVSAFPGVVSELAVPLRAGRVVVGVLNLESERQLPADAEQAVRPFVRALAACASRLRTRSTLDLAALARLFVHLGGLRDPAEIAELAAGSLPRVLPVSGSQVVVWEELGSTEELAVWTSDGEAEPPLTLAELETARGQAEPTAVCDVLHLSTGGRRRTVVWLPLRANASELGALVGVGKADEQADPSALDTAAVLAAHVGVSLDAALALGRERRSAVSDPLTGILNRRGLEERLERELERARECRTPLSLLVIDCDDFKDVNDRAGHEFGDTILREIADVLSRSLGEGADAARIGGDEFVVMLPDADAEAAEAMGDEIRRVLSDGLTDAGYPVRVSAGISTYPFDGGGPTALLRAADQALYAAKSQGKDRVASFRQLTGRASTTRAADHARSSEARRRGRGDRADSMLADAIAALRAIEAEDTAEGVCERLCKSLVFVVGATGCTASRVAGEYVVDTTEHALRDVRLSADTAYRIADFPLTQEVLRTGTPRAVSFAEGDVDRAEAFVLRDLGMNALLMLPLVVGGRPWGLVELYEMRLRTFSEDEIAVAEFLAHQAERRLETVGNADDPPRGRRIYELPREERGRPRTR